MELLAHLVFCVPDNVQTTDPRPGYPDGGYTLTAARLDGIVSYVLASFVHASHHAIII